MREKLLGSAFWAKMPGVSIRAKIMVIVAICIIASALALVWYVQHDVSASLRHQLQERGVTIGTGLASQSSDLILTNNQFTLYTLVRDISYIDEDIVYAFILDGGGNVLAHTFDEGFPTELLEINQVGPEEPYRVQALQTEDDRIQDVAIPILGGMAGVVRLGMSEATIGAIVAEQIRNILLWVALIMILGLYIAYGLASILTKPISQLAEAARALGKGDLKWKAPIWAKDEIGSLGIAFNEMSDELRRKEEMHEQLLAKVIGAQEDERKRIARELHDETSQALTSLKVGLRLVDDSTDMSQVREKIVELRALAAQTLEDVHHLATELRPSLLDDIGLIAAIQRYTKEYSTKMNINVDAHISGLNEQRLPPKVEITVYRVIQEALTNIAKHAEASNVSVILRYQDLRLIAIIEDDGKGFNANRVMASANEKNLGLFGMYERVSLIGGKLTIESRSGIGTTIFLETPLKLSKEAFDEQDKNISGR